MKHQVKKVFIAGGTGFLGYHSALLFRKLGIHVVTAALPGEIELASWFPADIPLQYCDLLSMSDDELLSLFSSEDFDTFVYALGPDDRVIPKAPAYAFFHDRLVVGFERIARTAKQAGIRRCVVMNSYFSTYDKIYDGQLSRFHPYIRARREQEALGFQLGEPGFFEVMMLEFPFIFGLMPGRKPLWRDHFLSHFEGGKAILFPSGGGTAAIDVSGIAQAVVAAAFNGSGGRAYPIGKINLSYRELIDTMMEALEDPRRYRGISPWLCQFGGMAIDGKLKKQGKQSGLDHGRLMRQILSQEFFIDPEPVECELGYAELGFDGGKNVIDSIKETIRACYPERGDKR
jgi:nucleoside-diphosphate-sugar epimerase